MPAPQTVSTPPTQTAPTRQRRRPGLAALVLTGLVWASGWSAFAGISAAGEGWQQSLIALAFCFGTVCPVLLAWRWPRIGGLVLAGLGVWASTFFHSRAAMVGLAIPAMALGLAFVTVGTAGAVRARRASRRGPARTA